MYILVIRHLPTYFQFRGPWLEYQVVKPFTAILLRLYWQETYSSVLIVGRYQQTVSICIPYLVKYDTAIKYKKAESSVSM